MSSFSAEPHDGAESVRSAGRRATGGERLILGLMSGTSADGIDVVALRVRGRCPRVEANVELHVYREFRPALRRRLLAIMAPARTRTEDLAAVHAELGEAFAAAALAAMQRLGPRRRPAAIGLAGQTVCHLPGRRGAGTVALQIGNPARVAARTGVLTVAEFRQSDIAAGGQGAPLVPWTDWVLLRSNKTNRAIQNIGGIANVTWLPAAAAAGQVVAFDTGPGNMVIDGLVRHLTAGRENMDRDGRRARRGRVLPGVLSAWLRHPYFHRRPPKTTGREMFGRVFLEAELPRLRAASRKTDDWVATATALTAKSITAAYRRWLLPSSRRLSELQNLRHPSPGARPAAPAGELVLCGGGADNPVLIEMLSAALPEMRLRQISDFGIAAHAKEAASFALLAAARLDGVPSNLPQVTGATRSAVLGAVFRP